MLLASHSLGENWLHNLSSGAIKLYCYLISEVSVLRSTWPRYVDIAYHPQYLCTRLDEEAFLEF